MSNIDGNLFARYVSYELWHVGTERYLILHGWTYSSSVRSFLNPTNAKSLVSPQKYYLSIILRKVKTMLNILVIEDDMKLNRVVCKHLNNQGYDATGCDNAKEAYDQMYARQYALIISDIMMPGIDGFEFANTIRKLNEDIPILFMTARDDFSAKEKGFQAGIDDYMVKPINLDELVLRIGALLRRSKIINDRQLSVGAFVMNIDEMYASNDGKEVTLTTREFNILFKLLSYPRHIFTRAQLMEEFWDVNTGATLRAVDVYIAKLRNKLSACVDFKIVTVRGVGYKAVLS